MKRLDVETVDFLVQLLARMVSRVVHVRLADRHGPPQTITCLPEISKRLQRLNSSRYNASDG